jgi:hypothetical protein
VSVQLKIIPLLNDLRLLIFVETLTCFGIKAGILIIH